jgi:hypothetical protein
MTHTQAGAWAVAFLFGIDLNMPVQEAEGAMAEDAPEDKA